MKNLPNKIYLQIGIDETDLDFNDLVEVSWCADKINNSDIEYVLAEQSKEQTKEPICDCDNQQPDPLALGIYENCGGDIKHNKE